MAEGGTVHQTGHEATNNNQTDTVNITSINFNSKQSVLVAKLKTSSNEKVQKYLKKLTQAVMEI